MARIIMVDMSAVDAKVTVVVLLVASLLQSRRRVLS